MPIRKTRTYRPRLVSRKISAYQTPSFQAIQDGQFALIVKDEEYKVRRYFRAALSWLFNMAGLVVLDSTVTLTYNISGVSPIEPFKLDAYPIQSIDSLTVDGESEDTSEVTLYGETPRPLLDDLDTSGDRAVFVLTCGYGADWSDVDPGVQEALVRMVTDYYEFRTSNVTGTIVPEGPVTWADVADPYLPGLL